MNLRDKIRTRKGLTIIEVLVASVTFMIGFSIMVFLLGRIIGDFSMKEKVIANNLGRMHLEQTLASGDFEDSITIETISKISFEIRKRVTVENRLARISIKVFRKKTGSELSAFYTERYIQ